jgi:8-oxo-dGTP diphosphatase
LTNGPLRIRQAVRALVIDPADRVLLVRFEFPAATVWALPGGGIEPGEAPLDALHRELAEELGLVGAQIGPHVWTREHLVRFQHDAPGRQWDGQRDQIHLVRTPAFEPVPHLDAEALAAERLFEIRWWTLPEIHASPARFAPRALSQHLHHLVRHGPPTSPIHTGS